MHPASSYGDIVDPSAKFNTRVKRSAFARAANLLQAGLGDGPQSRRQELQKH
jgi:hypothetical protein